MNTRGIILCPGDVVGVDWVSRMKRLKLNTLGLHSGGGANCDVVSRLGTMATEEFLQPFHQAGIETECESHVTASLLPPTLFETHPEYFAMRMIDAARIAESDWCITNPEVSALLEANAEKLARLLPSSSHRYHFWMGDYTYVYPCHCDKCSRLSPETLNLMCVNAMARGIRRADPQASLGYLAYKHCGVPVGIEPEENVFLEFAPYVRCYHHSIDDADCRVNWQFYRQLQDLLQFFPRESAQILEYWLDVSLFSDYHQEQLKKPFFKRELLHRDLEAYCRLGIRNFTTFAVYMGERYFAQYGDEHLQMYGQELNSFV